MVIAASLQACGVVFPFAMLTSICRSIVTICSGLYLWMGMTVFPPSGFSLIPPGTNLAGHVSTPGVGVGVALLGSASSTLASSALAERAAADSWFITK